jgi:hypothetical protein
MLWWRVEFTAEGGIKSCEQVEAVQKNKGLVCFISATTKVDACADAKAWHEQRKAKHRALSAKYNQARLDKGLCQKCGREPRRPGRKTGQKCHDATIRCQRERAAGRPCATAVYETPQAAQQAILTKLKERRARWKKKHGHCELWAHIVLKQFDALGPEAFRAWLVQKIEESKTT